MTITRASQGASKLPFFGKKSVIATVAHNAGPSTNSGPGNASSRRNPTANAGGLLPKAGKDYEDTQGCISAVGLGRPGMILAQSELFDATPVMTLSGMGNSQS